MAHVVDFKSRSTRVVTASGEDGSQTVKEANATLRARMHLSLDRMFDGLGDEEPVDGCAICLWDRHANAGVSVVSDQHVPVTLVPELIKQSVTKVFVDDGTDE